MPEPHIPDYHSPERRKKRKRLWVLVDRVRERIWTDRERRRPARRPIEDLFDDLEGDRNATVLGLFLMVISGVLVAMTSLSVTGFMLRGESDGEGTGSAMCCCFFGPLLVFFLGMVLVKIGK